MAASRMSRFVVFIGTWNTTGDVLETEDAPASKLIATDTYRWLTGKHFIVHDADARFGANATRSMEVIGYDPVAQEHFSQSYDDQGTTERFEVALNGKSWRIVGKSVRFDGKFDARSNRLIGLWELKGERVGWQPWIKLRLDRA